MIDSFGLHVTIFRLSENVDKEFFKEPADLSNILNHDHAKSLTVNLVVGVGSKVPGPQSRLFVEHKQIGPGYVHFHKVPYVDEDAVELK